LVSFLPKVRLTHKGHPTDNREVESSRAPLMQSCCRSIQQGWRSLPAHSCYVLFDIGLVDQRYRLLSGRGLSKKELCSVSLRSLPKREARVKDRCPRNPAAAGQAEAPGSNEPFWPVSVQERSRKERCRRGSGSGNPGQSILF